MSFLADLTALVREGKELLQEFRCLAKDLREPTAAPPRHPLDAPPLPTAAEVTAGVEQEAAEWAALQKQCDEWLIPAPASPQAASGVELPSETPPP